VPEAVLVPPVATLPFACTANVAVGGYSIVIVGIVTEEEPADVNVIDVTRPNVPVPLEPASLSLVPIVHTAVAPDPPEIVIAGAGALPLP
jgi:hypothetical protein